MEEARVGAKILSLDPGEKLDVQNEKEALDGTGGITGKVCQS